MAQKSKNVVRQAGAFSNLANAIIIQAVEDYEAVLKKYRDLFWVSGELVMYKNPDPRCDLYKWRDKFDSNGERLALERFFKSQYFCALSRGAVSGECVIQHVKSKVFPELYKDIG